jgi:hypothetical protein
MSDMKPKTSRELLEALGDLMDSVPSNGREDDEEHLRAAGLDPKEVGHRARTLVEGLIANSRKEASLERRRALSDFAAFDPGPMPESRPELIALIQSEAPQSMVAHRDFEDEDDEDLRSLLREIRFLRREEKTEGD